MADMSFQDFLALHPTRAQFIGPVADNIRKRIVERMAAALEFVQYGPGGAAGGPVLPKFARDYGSEVGLVMTEWPALIVVPIETTSATGDVIAQEHQIHVEVAMTGEDGEALTRNIITYLRAVIVIILCMSNADLVGGIPSNPGGVMWDVINHSYDALRRRRGTSIYFRSASCRVEVKTVETFR